MRIATAATLFQRLETAAMRCSIVHGLMPLLRDTGCVLSYNTAYAMTRQVLHARGADGGGEACNAPLHCWFL